MLLCIHLNNNFSTLISVPIGFFFFDKHIMYNSTHIYSVSSFICTTKYLSPMALD